MDDDESRLLRVSGIDNSARYTSAFSYVLGPLSLLHSRPDSVG